MYWISAILFAVVLTIILLSDYISNDSPEKTEKRFRVLLHWVIIFCILDCFWGLCDAKIIKSDKAFFVISELYHISTALTTYFWLSYILTYLGTHIKKRTIFLCFNFTIIIIELSLVIINLFKPVIFEINNGIYIASPFRPLNFFTQYSFYIVIGIVTFISALKERNKLRKQYLTVFAVCLSPIIMGFFQMIYPNGPFYSMGYFLGCFVVHIFVIARDANSLSRNQVLNSLANIYYSMHLFNLEKGTVEIILEPNMISQRIVGITSSQEMLVKTIKASVSEEYVNMALEFVDLSTLQERLKNQDHIWCEFIGRNFGWVRIRFIPVEWDGDTLKKVVLTSQIIDQEKKTEINLLFQSNNDELTGLYNRRSYDREIAEIEESGKLENLVCVSMDLNNLKTTNDNMGHEAGDELIKGAAECIKKCFGLYGKVFRTGGDEFCALIYTSSEKLEQIKADFNDIIIQWSGDIVKTLSISAGYTAASELKKPSLRNMIVMADERMYSNKTAYYKAQGIDRRGQKDAYTALCSLYSKILKINITEDSFKIIDIKESEQTPAMKNNSKLSECLKDFVDSGNIHESDVDMFKEKTNLTYMKNYFKSNTELRISYKRKSGVQFNQAIMDIIPASDYTPDNQSLYMYVRI